MKYSSLRVLAILGVAVSLTGCYCNSDYDVTRIHDIYRINYKYKPPTQIATEAPIPSLQPSSPTEILPRTPSTPSTVPSTPAPAPATSTPAAASFHSNSGMTGSVAARASTVVPQMSASAPASKSSTAGRASVAAVSTHRTVKPGATHKPAVKAAVVASARRK